MPFQLAGVTTTHVAEVDENGNQLVRTPIDPLLAGFVKLLDGAGLPVLTTENGALSVSQDSILFSEQVDGSAINTNKWITSVSGMTVAQANGYITLNNAAVTTINSYAILTSIKYFPMYSYLPLRVTFNAATPDLPQNLATMEMGIGLAATTAAPTDGAFFRWTSSAEFKCVINNGGVETSSAPLTAPAILEAEIFEIVIVEDLVLFYVGDNLAATVECPVGQAFPTNNGRLPIFCRVYTASSAPAFAPILYMGQAIVVQEGAIQNRPWSEFLATMGNGSYQSPVTAFLQTANHANSTSPTSATLSNTAAGYTTLGGRFQFAAVASAATDFALFAYQVPVGYQLFVTGVSINTMNTGAAVGLTATILDWSIGINSSAISLATADGAGTWAPRRVPLGMQGFPTLSSIGTAGADIDRDFEPPLVVDSGRYLHIIVQVPLGAATGSEIFRGDVTIQGFFE